MGTMFTGSDKTGASLYYIDNDATRCRGKLFAVGSGGTFAYGVLDTNYRYDMSLDEAVKLIPSGAKFPHFRSQESVPSTSEHAFRPHRLRCAAVEH